MSKRFLSLSNAPPAMADVLIRSVPHARTVTYKPGTANGPAATLALISL
jgi:arginase family enzyme